MMGAFVAERDAAAPWLQGLKVVEIGQFLSAPYAGMIFSDLGADVMKVEVPGRGDDGRRMGPSFQGGDALIFRDLNRGKKSTAIDFKSEDGQAQLRHLISSADIVISNLRAGILEKFALDAESTLNAFPSVIYCELSAFGHKGPLRNDPGYEPVAQAFSGLASVNGHPSSPPVRTGPSVVDLGSGMWIVISALAALQKRNRTDGKGCLIRLSLLETALGWIAPDISGYLNEGRIPSRRGNGQPLLAPYDAFEASDGMVFIAVGSDVQFRKFAKLLDRADWASSPQFKTNELRLKNKETLNLLINEIMQTNTRSYWLGLLKSEGVPCSLVQNIQEAVSSAQVDLLGMIRKSRITGRYSVGLPFTIDSIRPGRSEDAPTLNSANKKEEQ